MRISFFFQDNEGVWTPAKQEQALRAIAARCGATDDKRLPIVCYPPPIAQPRKTGAQFYQYEAYADIDHDS